MCFFNFFYNKSVTDFSQAFLKSGVAQKQASLKVLKSGGLEPRSLIGVYAYVHALRILRSHGLLDDSLYLRHLQSGCDCQTNVCL